MFYRFRNAQYIKYISKKNLCLKKNNKNKRKIHTKLLAKVTSGSGIRGKSGFYFASFCTI